MLFKTILHQMYRHRAFFWRHKGVAVWAGGIAMSLLRKKIKTAGNKFWHRNIG